MRRFGESGNVISHFINYFSELIALPLAHLEFKVIIFGTDEFKKFQSDRQRQLIFNRKLVISKIYGIPVEKHFDDMILNKLKY